MALKLTPYQDDFDRRSKWSFKELPIQIIDSGTPWLLYVN